MEMVGYHHLNSERLLTILALNNLGSVSSEEIQSTMAEIDMDGDGYIDYNEFVAFCKANPGLMKDIAKVF